MFWWHQVSYHYLIHLKLFCAYLYEDVTYSNCFLKPIVRLFSDSTSNFPLALKFGLEPIDDVKQNISTTNLIKELSKCSRQSLRRTNTPVLHSIAVQTDSLFASHKQPSNLCKKRSLNKACFARISRGILQLPLINSTILAPKEDYDELYRFNQQSTYKHKSPILPSLYKLARM